MGAAAARVQGMVNEDRIVTLESDAKHIFTDIGEIKGSVKALEGRVGALERKVDHLDEKIDGAIAALQAFKTEVAKEFAALRDLMRVQIGELRTEMGELRTEMGELRTGMAQLRAEMIERFGNLKIWVLVTVAGSVASLISMALSIATFVHGWKSP